MNIGFSTTSSLLSTLVRKLTRSKISHTYIKFLVAGENIVLHATQHGVNTDYYNNFVKKNRIYAEFKLNVSIDAQNKMLSYAIRQTDKPYDFISLVGFLWVIINKSFGRKTKNPFSSAGAYFCSELLVQTLKAGKFPNTDNLNSDNISPEDFLEFISNHKLAEKVQ